MWRIILQPLFAFLKGLKKIILVEKFMSFGNSKDKDLKGAIEVIEKYASQIAFLPANHPRLYKFKDSTPAEEALQEAKKRERLP